MCNPLKLILAFTFIILTLADAGQTVQAAGGYLAGYEDAEPKPAGISWLSTIAYLLSLFAVFAIVVVMAYMAAKFLGGRFNAHLSSHGGRVLALLPLGANRSVCIVDLADRVFLLGVTDGAISLLAEIDNPEEIARLRSKSLDFAPDFDLSPISGAFSKFSSKFRK